MHFTRVVRIAGRIAHSADRAIYAAAAAADTTSPQNSMVYRKLHAAIYRNMSTTKVHFVSTFTSWHSFPVCVRAWHFQNTGWPCEIQSTQILWMVILDFWGENARTQQNSLYDLLSGPSQITCNNAVKERPARQRANSKSELIQWCWRAEHSIRNSMNVAHKLTLTQKRNIDNRPFLPRFVKILFTIRGGANAPLWENEKSRIHKQAHTWT